MAQQFEGTGYHLQKDKPKPPPRRSSLINAPAPTTTGTDSKSKEVRRKLPPPPPPKRKPGKPKLSSKLQACENEYESPDVAWSAIRQGSELPVESSVDAPATLPGPVHVTVTQSDCQPITSSSVQESTTADGIPLTEFAETYSKELPMNVRVHQGYYGQNLQLEVGDLYTVHFVKHKEVARVTDAGGSDYSIPLSSSLQFGMVFSPKSKRGEDIQKIEFEKVSDLMALHTLPKVVCAMKAFKGVAEQSSVEEGEILIIADTKRSKAYSKTGLKVFSLLTKSEKTLPGSCAGRFSIYPPLLRMHLPEFASHLSNSLPFQIQVFLDKEAPSRVSNILATFLSSPVTVQEVRTELSLVASSAKMSIKPKGSKGLPLVDIPLLETFSEVQLSPIHSSDKQEQQTIIESARKILSSFDPALQMSVKATKSGRNHRIQSLLYSTLRTGSEGVGVKLVSSLGEVVFGQRDEDVCEDVYEEIEVKQARLSAIYETIPRENEHLVSSNLDKTQPSIATANSRRTTAISERVSRQESSEIPGDTTIQQLDIARITSSQSASHHMVRAIIPSSLIAQNRGSLPPIPPYVPLWQSVHYQDKQLSHYDVPRSVGHSTMQGHLSHYDVPRSVGHSTMQGQLSHYDVPRSVGHSTMQASEAKSQVHTYHTSVKGEKLDKEENKRFLHSLSDIQVQNLLEAMDLAHYCEAFAREHISGEILAELDNGDLQRELGVDSKIHRVRLMKVISGKHSAQNILAGVDPYSKFVNM